MLALVRQRIPSVQYVSTISTILRRANSTSTGQLEGETLIHAKLTEKFAPSQLQVQDVSGGCGSFYAITITSEAFKGLSMVKQHKLVTETLKKEIEGIHGLQIKTIPQ